MQLIISYKLKYLTLEKHNDLASELDGILRMLTKLYQSLQTAKEYTTNY